MVGVAGDEPVAAHQVDGLHLLDHVHRERQPGDPGLARGFVGEIVSLLAWAAGIFAVRFFYTPGKTIAAGIVGSDLVFSVRNVGYVRAAGEVVRGIVEGLGVGGGHRSMAKGIIPLKAFRKRYGSATRTRIREVLHAAFVAAISSND